VQWGKGLKAYLCILHCLRSTVLYGILPPEAPPTPIPCQEPPSPNCRPHRCGKGRTYRGLGLSYSIYARGRRLRLQPMHDEKRSSFLLVTRSHMHNSFMATHFYIAVWFMVFLLQDCTTIL
jgi:hypothetical protein